MKKGRNSLDSTELLQIHPELHELFISTAAVYGNIIFAKRMELEHTQSELSKLAKVKNQRQQIYFLSFVIKDKK